MRRVNAIGWLIAAALVVVSPGLLGAAPLALDPGIQDVATAAGSMIDAVRTGQWLAGLAILVTLLTAALRRPWAGRLLDRLPKRTRVLVPLLLGCLAALLTGLAGGVPWTEAMALAVLTGPSAVALHQGVARSVLGLSSPASGTGKG